MVSMDASGQRLLGIDWGTSNRRAYLVDASGACLDAHEDDQGILAGVERGLIRGMHTFMTGELFATLGKQGTLAPLMNGPDDAAAFAAGVDEARRGAPLSQSLFGVRARVMTNTLPAAQARSCVSGLLIGAELLAARELVGAAAQDIVSIAAPGLHARYAAAAGRVGLALRALDPDRVYRAALSHFIKEIEP
jgi:2-dehydro-3-deoxygalactonokinase